MSLEQLYKTITLFQKGRRKKLKYKNYSDEESAEFDRYLIFADKLHSNQSYGKYPYSTHLLAVAKIAMKHKLPARIVKACILHDVLEDCGITEQDLRTTYDVPYDVIELVKAVTDEPGVNRKERKQKTYPKIRKAGQEAIIVKLCDRIVNTMFNMVSAEISEKSQKRSQSLHEMYQNEYSEFRQKLDYGVEDNWKMSDTDWIEIALWRQLEALSSK
jgi:guanosine-3',5'-bis(diphosphate) 3'-pyrophosphohydrolase